MYMITRRMGSTRYKARPIKVHLVPNQSGQGGVPFLSFEKEDGTIISIHPETEGECKALLSAVHHLYHNFGDDRIAQVKFMEAPKE